jgi:multidrug efflux pump subunit AcrA (membrane-fusion protein)
MNRKAKRAFLITGIIAAAVGIAVGLGQLKPPPETKDIPDVAPLVEVLPLVEAPVSFSIASQGTVRPRTETILSAEVSGSIVSISQKFIAGGVFAQGEELMRIDPTNYTVAVDQAEATLEQRQIEYDGALKLRTQGYRAESEYASAAAALATAKADLVKAERNLERTHITLPYDGMVRVKEADLGQYVNPGTRLGVTFATDYAEGPAGGSYGDTEGAAGALAGEDCQDRGRGRREESRHVRSGTHFESVQVEYCCKRGITIANGHVRCCRHRRHDGRQCNSCPTKCNARKQPTDVYRC